MKTQTHHIGDFYLTAYRSNWDGGCDRCGQAEASVELTIATEDPLDTEDCPNYQDGEYIYICNECYDQVVAEYKERERMANLVFIRYGTYHPKSIANYWLGGAK